MPLEASPTPTTSVVLTGDRDLTRRLPFFDLCVVLVVAGLLSTIGFRRPELLALAAPFLVAAAAALAMWKPVEATLTVRFDKTHILEGEDVAIVVEVTSASGIDRLELELHPSSRLEAVGILRAVTRVEANSTSTISFTVRAAEWGVASVDKVTVRVADKFAMFGGEIDVRPEHTMNIGLPEDRVSASLEADRFRRIVGSHLSNDRGQGLEIADIRPFQAGDSTRDINWRISNRRQEPWITLRHPDRSTVVIVIVDAHDGGDDDERLTQRRSVSAALALARGHLAMHDQVGLLVVGRTLRWLPPKLGRNQLFQIGDQLVAVSNASGASLRLYRPPAVSTIPNNAIVVAVSPLNDPLMVALVAEIRSRGNPVSVLVPDDADDAAPSKIVFGSRVNDHARRLAHVERRIGVQSLRERGVAIVPWADDEAVVTVIEATRRLRQSMARMRSW